MRVLLVMLFTGVFVSGCSQRSPYQKFIDSFVTKPVNEVIEFQSVFHKADQMTIDQANTFVYDNDSTKLYCREEIFNMETEKVEGYSTNLYLPRKLFKVTTDDYLLICYSIHVCPDLKVHDVTELRIVLKILNNNYQAMDTLTVHREKYDFSRASLFNPRTGKIFQLSSEKPSNGLEALMIGINPKTLKFEIEKRKANTKNMTDDLEKNIQLLGWETTFLN